MNSTPSMNIKTLEKTQEFSEISRKISELIIEREPSRIDIIPFEDHPLPPFISKADWTVLGDAIKVIETLNLMGFKLLRQI